MQCLPRTVQTRLHGTDVRLDNFRDLLERHLFIREQNNGFTLKGGKL